MANNRRKDSHTPIFRCRKLTGGDLEDVMRWRMLAHVTKYMYTDPVLTMETQRRWFDRLCGAGELFYWIIEADETPCGVVNLADVDMANKRCGWGYYVAEKKQRSFQLAMSLEMSLYDHVFYNIGLNKVTSESLSINTASIKMHELCGCETEGVLSRHIFKNGQYYDVVLQAMLAEKWEKVRKGFNYVKINF